MPGRIIVVVICSLLVSFCPRPCLAAGPFQDPAEVIAALIPAEVLSMDSTRHEPQRLVAATLTLTLGVFAAHRLYFGTDVKVPIIYGLTFGGFGVLVLIDLAHILFTKDLTAYMNNNKVFMWSSGRATSLTPP